VVVQARRALVGREREQAEVRSVLTAAADLRGGLVLVSGEAGVGKTHLVEECAAASGLFTLAAAAQQQARVPYGQIVEVLRSYLRAVPDGLRDCGPLSGHLALLLPELGPHPRPADRSTLFEVIRCAFVTLGRRAPTVVFLDDLHWADDTTLELLPPLAAGLDDEPVVIVGAYRSDEIPRGHPLRRMRTELRRVGRLRELSLDALVAEETARLVETILGARPGRALATTIHLRTQGVPFFVEELTEALLEAGRLQEGPYGIELPAGGDLPLPEGVRDAVLLRAAGLSEGARKAIEIAAAAGERFELEVVAALGGEGGLEEALESGFVVERGAGAAAFRHSLTREALYHAMPWTRRRALHRAVAAELEGGGAPAAAVAEHWLFGRELQRARVALLEAAEASCHIHAYRDAATAVRRALELWPEGEDEAGRLDALERLGECAELSGEHDEAAKAWLEAAEGRAAAGEMLSFARLQRRLASLFELQCAWEPALAARTAAAESFSEGGLPAEAALDRITAAANLQSAGALSPALDLIRIAARQAEEAERVDLTTRAAALEGLIGARLGQLEQGLELARSALRTALSESLVGPAAEIHDRLGLILENASEYRDALDIWHEGYEFCELHGIRDRAHVCLSCLAYVMRKTGEWDKAIAISRRLIDEDAPRSARSAGLGHLGLIHALRGDVRRARPLLRDSSALADQIGFLIMRVDAAWGLARVDELEGADESAAKRARKLLELARQSEDCHVPLPALRWSTTFFGSRGDFGSAGACVGELARMASAAATAEARAALAHGVGEVALVGGEPERAADEFLRALDLLRDLELPVDRAETQLRAGVALGAVGEHEAAVDRFTDAYRTARKLGMRPLAQRATVEVEKLGERVERRLGRKAAGDLQRGGLSRRELEIVRLLATGQTNREIARGLFLSPRTVDMHVRNVLAKLGCRTRTEATKQAADLGLLQ
jgi:DNA-binding CsgD family transcriptional regulator